MILENHTRVWVSQPSKCLMGPPCSCHWSTHWVSAPRLSGGGGAEGRERCKQKDFPGEVGFGQGWRGSPSGGRGWQQWVSLSPGSCVGSAVSRVLPPEGPALRVSARCWHLGILSHCSYESAVDVKSPGTGAGVWNLCSHGQFHLRSPWGRPTLQHPEALAGPRATTALCPGGHVGAWRVGAQSTAHPKLTS